MTTRLAALSGLKATIDGCNFTTFVLPFRYALKRRFLPACGVHYREEPQDPSDPTLAQRVHYLTGETREIMFDPVPQAGTRLSSAVARETRWLELSAPASLLWYAPQATRTFKLELTARVVLFDGETARRSRSPHRRCGCIGFLLLTVPMSEGMSFADMLDLNEKLRLVRYQYPGQGEKLALRDLGSVPPAMTRYPGFAVAFPGGAPTPDRETPPVDGVGLWRAFLSYPVRVNGKTCRLEFDPNTYPDDRAFVVSHACIQGVPWETDRSSRLWMLWHQFLHVEADEVRSACELVPYEDEWIRSRTYFRWAQHPAHARLYGFSNFSCCTLCLPNAFAPATQHFRTIYLDQLLLILYQRTAVTAFSRELSALTQRWKTAGWSCAKKGLLELRQGFEQFVNLYWFPEFTNQVQGLEMYEIARRELDNLTLFEELRTEMAGTWGFMEARATELLTRGGAVVAVFTLVAAYLAMGIFDSKSGRLQFVSPTFFVGLSVLAVLGVLWVAIHAWAIGDWRRVWRRALLTVLVILLLWAWMDPQSFNAELGDLLLRRLRGPP